MTYQDYLRFERRVQRTELCWLWTGNKAGYGYGYFNLDHSRRLKAHRAAWQFANGQRVPTGKWILHRCNTRLCVNPDHLYVGTVLDNNRDTVKAGTHPFMKPEWKAKYDHCNRGHLLHGAKKCPLCLRERQGVDVSHPKT